MDKGNENISKYYCYIIRSTNPAFSNSTYNGSTNNLVRRLRQHNGEIVGGINIDEKQDPTYLTIDWEDKTNQFLVVHRLAVKEEFWQNRIGKKLMLFVEEVVREEGYQSIRLDTYSGNPKAMEFYLRLGYSKLGHIHLKEGKNEYYCFEKVI